MALRNLPESELLPGERVMTSRRAKLFTRLGEPRPESESESAAGIGDAAGQVVAGRLYLTNLRLVFRARGARRPDAAVSVLLPTVKDVRHTPAGRKWRFEVTTGTRRFTFVLRGALALVAATVLRIDADAERVRWLAALGTEQLPLICGDVALADRVRAANPALTTLPPGEAAAAIAGSLRDEGDALRTSGALNLVELLRDERCG